MQRVLLFAAILILIGCKSSREKEVVGSWTSQKSMKITVAEDKTFIDNAGPLKLAGSWSIDGDDVTFVEKTFNGKPIEEAKANITRSLSRIAAAKRPAIEKYLVDMGKPNVLTLSADGKTLTTNKAKDPNAEPWTPLTKG